MREPETSIVPHAASRLLAMLVASASLAGCAAIHDRVEAVQRASSSPVATVDERVDPPGVPLKTVRNAGVKSAAVPQSRFVEADAVPSPREIFDFHPAGQRADGWRQPFIIDRNDGPLTREVDRSEAELRDFKANIAAHGSEAGLKRCSETEVAQGARDCASARPRAATAVSRDPAALR